MRRKHYLILSSALVVIVVGLVVMLLVPKLGVMRPKPEVFFSSFQAEPGEFFVVRVDPLGEEGSVLVKAPFIAEDPCFFRQGKGLVALIPVSYRSDPGAYTLEVVVTKGSKRIYDTEQVFTVNARDFAIQKLYVSPELHAKRDETLWAEDHMYTGRARAQSNPDPLWHGSFLEPLKGRITTQFGQIRYINDQESGRHSGLDIASPQGTPVLSTNDGVVVLARLLNVTGNTVILDHGLNLFTSYSHLDRIAVELGQRVTKGQVIGTVGSTGFSTGPHLHWAVSIGGTFVDPCFVLESANYLEGAILRGELSD